MYKNSRIADWVTHATDRPMWGLRPDMLKPDELVIARQWLDTVDAEVQKRLEGDTHPLDEAVTLREDTSIAWVKDDRWVSLMGMAEHLEM